VYIQFTKKLKIELKGKLIIQLRTDPPSRNPITIVITVHNSFLPSLDFSGISERESSSHIFQYCMPADCDLVLHAMHTYVCSCLRGQFTRISLQFWPIHFMNKYFHPYMKGAYWNTKKKLKCKLSAGGRDNLRSKLVHAFLMITPLWQLQGTIIPCIGTWLDYFRGPVSTSNQSDCSNYCQCNILGTELDIVLNHPPR